MYRLRDWLNNNPAAGAGVAGGLVIVAILVLFVTQWGGGRGTGTEYFWNVDTGEVEQVERGQHPPITNRRGQTLVRAHIYSCGDCRPGDWKVLRLERYPEDIHEQIMQLEERENGEPVWDEFAEQDIFAQTEWFWDPGDDPDRVQDDGEWIFLRDERTQTRAYELQRQRLNEMCEDGSPRRCRPGRR